jgi:hypothetical protein
MQQQTSRSPTRLPVQNVCPENNAQCSVTFDESTGNFPCWFNSDRNDPVEELHHGMLQPNVWVLLRSSHTRDRFREDRQLLLLRKRF